MCLPGDWVELNYHSQPFDGDVGDDDDATLPGRDDSMAD